MAGCFLATPSITQAQVEGCEDVACVRSTTRLASVDSQDGALLNAITSGLLGTDVNLTALEWNALTQAEIGLVDFLDVLQADLGVGSPGQVLNTDVTLSQIIDAAADVAQTDGNTATVDALGVLSADILSTIESIQLGDLLDITTNEGSISDASFFILELVQGSISLFNYEHAVSTPSPVQIQGVSVPGVDVAQLELSAEVITPPVIACGPVGTEFYSAGIRTKLGVSLANINLPLGIAGVNASLSQLDIYAAVARGRGVITMIDALNNIIEVEADPGVVDLYLGHIEDDVFFDETETQTLLDSLQHGTIGSIEVDLAGIPVTELSINALAYTEGNDNTTDQLLFSGSYPQTLNYETNSSFITNLINGLLGNLDVTVTPYLPIISDTIDSILDVIDGVLVTTLTGILEPVLEGGLDPLLGSLGVSLGEMSVTASSPQRNCFIELAGCVYEDTNHNATKDPAEEGTGLTLYAKLVDRASPSQADTVVSVDPTTGEYSFGLTGMGHYDIVIDNNDDETDTDPHKPSEWVGTENPDQQISDITITGEGAIADQNFGLFHGSKVSGMVFNDNGLNGGTAHDGVLQPGEEKLHEMVVRALTAASSEDIDRTRTNAEGEFTLWIENTYDGQDIVIREEQGEQYVSVTGDPGSTNGTYSRPEDRITYTNSTGTEYDGVIFADVPANSFTPLGRQYANAGSVIFYRHSYKTKTPGEVTFGTDETSSPENDAWNYTLFEDANCNGEIDPEEDTEISAPKTMDRGEEVCLVARVQVPAGIEEKAQHVLDIQADYLLETTPISYPRKVHDETIVGIPSGAGLVLEKTVDKPAAVPGEGLTYMIVYRNNSSEPLQMLSIDDSTPSYTLFSAAGCGSLPDALTDCTIEAPSSGEEGTIIWELEGELMPGKEGEVSYTVIIED